MTPPTALLTFSLGPVQAFIAQARRVADLWAGSDLLSHLIAQAVRKVQESEGASMVFPSLGDDEPIPPGLPNRFVCRVPRDRAGDLASELRKEVETEWNRRVAATVEQLRSHGIDPSEALWTDADKAGMRQTDHLLEIAWSWEPESRGYAEAAERGARRFAASRLFRPFTQVHEGGEKCAVCGVRTALPDGQRGRVRSQWEQASRASEKTPAEPYLRWDQSRLCLVCATKRFYPSQRDKTPWFASFQDFEPPPRFAPFDRFEPSRETPYFAIVAMDGDRMAEILGWREDRLASRDAEAFHRDLSRALSGFAASLRTAGSADLNLEALRRAPLRGRRNPQLVYAGGEDVLLVCDPRDALGLAWKIRDAYREALRPVVERHASPDDRRRFTISAAVLFAHTKHPAGLLFRDAQELLKKKAKQEEGRNAVALRLAKRGGVPVETAFPWDEPAGDGDGRPTWVESFDALVGDLATGALSSRQTFNLRRDDRVLAEVFQTEEEWSVWLRDRLSRREPAAGIDIGRTAGRLAPFFRRGKTEALRILRFLVREVREAGEASR